MADQIDAFAADGGNIDHAWIIPYAYWVDTRLLSPQTGHFDHDFTLWPDQIPNTVEMPGPKLFILKPEDEETIALLQSTYPQGNLARYPASVPGHDFLMYRVP